MSVITRLFSLACLCLCVWAATSDSKYDILKEEWCGDANCYEILGVTPLDDRRTIKQKYNNITLELHPDKNPNATDAQKALYMRMMTAYEILSNEQSRSKYDEYLRLKSSLDSPRENVFFVLALVYALIVFVVLQYQKQRYSRLRTGILELNQVQTFLQKNKNINITGKSKKKGKKGKGKKKKGASGDASGVDEDEEAGASWMDAVSDGMISNVLNELNITVPGWTGEAPTFSQAAVDVPVFVLSKCGDFVFFIKWHVQHTLLKQALSDSDREELCRRHFEKSTQEWDALDEREKSNFMQRPGPWRTNKKRNKKKNN